MKSKFSNSLRMSVVFIVALACSGAAFAQDINLLPEGQTLITLSVTERMKVQQDVLLASLRIEVDDRDAQVVQDRINTGMEEALRIAREVSEVKVSTGYYSVYQYNNQPQGGRTDNMWRGTQSLSLESQDADALLELAGRLQGMGFLMNQLTYQLSQEKADEVRDTMLESAISRATANAERAGRAMGKTDVDIAILDVDSPMSYGNPIMMRDASASLSLEMSTPSAEAGETEVTLTVRIQAVAK